MSQIEALKLEGLVSSEECSHQPLDVSSNQHLRYWLRFYRNGQHCVSK